MSAQKKEQLGFRYTYKLCHNYIALGKTQWLLVIYLRLRMDFELILSSFLLLFFAVNATQQNRGHFGVVKSTSSFLQKVYNNIFRLAKYMKHLTMN